LYNKTQNNLNFFERTTNVKLPIDARLSIDALKEVDEVGVDELAGIERPHKVQVRVGGDANDMGLRGENGQQLRYVRRIRELVLAANVKGDGHSLGKLGDIIASEMEIKGQLDQRKKRRVDGAAQGRSGSSIMFQIASGAKVKLLELSGVDHLQPVNHILLGRRQEGKTINDIDIVELRVA